MLPVKSDGAQTGLRAFKKPSRSASHPGGSGLRVNETTFEPRTRTRAVATPRGDAPRPSAPRHGQLGPSIPLRHATCVAHAWT